MSGGHRRISVSDDTLLSVTAGRISAIRPKCRRSLLLDPKTPTATRIDGGDGGSLTLNVVTQEVAWQLSRQGHGFITLAYTLLIGTQPLSVLRVELTLTKEENRT